MARNKPNDLNIILDQFSTTDLKVWKKVYSQYEEYDVRLFYQLEALRSLDHEKLCEALRNTNSVDIKEKNWWRIVDLKYAEQPLSSIGSFLNGARFNIGDNLENSNFNSFPALYIAAGEETAQIEKFGKPQTDTLDQNELALRKPNSYVVLNLDVNLNNVFDLTKAINLKDFNKIISKYKVPEEISDIAKKIGLDKPQLITKTADLKKMLLANWRYFPVQFNLPAYSQMFGRLVKDAGYEGILFPSTQKTNGKCLCVFPENLNPSSEIKISDDCPSFIKDNILNIETWKES